MKTVSTLFLLLIVLQVAQSQSIKTLIEREISYGHFSGCIQVKQKGEVIYEQCAGYASRAEKLLNQKEVPFDIGSISKQFTAAAILHLVNEGKLDLTGEINQYLAQYASPHWEGVTIHHLLTHTSGIPSLFQSGQGVEEVLPQAKAVSLDVLIGYFANAALLFDPGEEYRYSNSGYVLLAAIIQEVTGQTFGECIEVMVKSCGLENTTFGPPSGEFAKPYYGYRSDLEKEGVLFHKMWTIGAGGIYSTVNDLTKWIETIKSEQFLTAELRSVYLQKHVARGGGKCYGYGWDILVKEGIISHDGMNFGYVSYLGFKPEKELVVAILTNQSHQSMTLTGASAKYIEDLQWKIWSVLDEKPVDVMPQIITANLQNERYEFQDGYQVEIVKSGEQYTVCGIGDYSPTRMIFQYPLEETDQKSNGLLTVASAIKRGKFWGMGSVCDGQMKLAVYTGLFSWGFGQITKGFGEVIDARAYEMRESTGIIRVYGKEEVLDVIVYFNAEDQVQGVFEHGYYQYTDLRKYLAYPVGSQKIYLDGFPYGEFSAIISISEDRLEFNQNGRKFIGKKIGEN